MAQASGGGGGQDDSLGPMWVAALTIIGLFLLWKVGHAYISAFLLYIKQAQVYVLRYFMPTQALAKLSVAIQNSGAADIEFERLSELCAQVGEYFRYPLIVLSVALAIVAYVGHPTFRFRRTYDMNSLLAAEVENWPQVLPVKDLGLVDMDPDKKPWAMSEQPLQFARKNRLVYLEQMVSDDEMRTKLDSRLRVFDTEALRIFALQLGEFWKGPEAMPIHRRAIFAVCAARANHDIAQADALIQRISGSSRRKIGLDFSEVDDVIRKYKKTKPVQYVTERHAYVLTVMASMLLLARQDGVFATAEFIWLKPIDRELWYVLNNVGRQTAFPEVAGVFAHWMAEREVKRKLYVPMVQEAVEGLQAALNDIKYIPAEEKQYI